MDCRVGFSVVGRRGWEAKDAGRHRSVKRTKRESFVPCRAIFHPSFARLSSDFLPFPPNPPKPNATPNLTHHRSFIPFFLFTFPQYLVLHSLSESRAQRLMSTLSSPFPSFPTPLLPSPLLFLELFVFSIFCY